MEKLKKKQKEEEQEQQKKQSYQEERKRKAPIESGGERVVLKRRRYAEGSKWGDRMAAAAASAAQLEKVQGKKLSDAQIVAIAVRAEFKVGWQALKLRHEGWLQVHSCAGPATVFCHAMEGPHKRRPESPVHHVTPRHANWTPRHATW